VLGGRELVVEYPLAQGAVGAERVAAEKDPVCTVEGHHRLGPVNVRGFEKLEDLAAAEIERVAGFHLAEVVGDLEKIPHEGDSLRGRNDLYTGVSFADFGDEGGMVGFEMVEYQIIDFFEAGAAGVELLLELSDRAGPVPGKVYEGGLFALHDI